MQQLRVELPIPLGCSAPAPEGTSKPRTVGTAQSCLGWAPGGAQSSCPSSAMRILKFGTARVQQGAAHSPGPVLRGHRGQQFSLLPGSGDRNHRVLPGLVPGELSLNPERGLRLIWGQQSGGSDSHITQGHHHRDTALALGLVLHVLQQQETPIYGGGRWDKHS